MGAYRKLKGYLVCLAILWVLLLAAQVQAQSNIEFKESGFAELTQNQVNYIAQDKKGYLYLATYNGVYRYDGYRIERLKASNKAGEPLPISSVNHMCLTEDNHLWIAFRNESLVDLDLKASSYTAYTHKEGKEGLSSTLINCIVADKEENIWIGTFEGGLDCFEKSTNKFIHYKSGDHGLETDSITALCLDKYDNLYVGSNGVHEGMYYFDKKTTTFSKVYDNVLRHENYYVMTITMDRNNNLWCCDDECTFMVDLATKEITPKVGTNKPASTLHAMGSGPIMISDDIAWVGSYSGLYMYDMQSKKTVHFEHNDANPSSLNSNRILCLFRDNSGNIWIGTDEGLMKVSKVQAQIFTAKHLITEPGYTRKKLVRSLYVAPKENTIWQGTSGEGLQKLNADGTWSEYLFNDYTMEYGYNYVNDIHPLQNGNLALATRNGLQIFDTKKQKFLINKFCVPTKVRSAYKMQLWDLWEDERSVMWLGTKLAGLYLCDLSKNTLERVDAKNSAISVWHIFRDRFKPQVVWLGTSKGLLYIDRATSTDKMLVPLFHNAKKALAETDIFFVQQDKHGILWLSTANAGLLKYSPATGELKQYTTLQGLPTDMLSGILEDGSGHLWISCTNGIFVFDPQTEKVIRKYNAMDGLSSNRFNFKSCSQLPNGEMFFGSSDGVNYFYPDSIKSNTYRPRLFITSFKTLYNERVQDLSLDSTVTLSYNQNSFAVEYASDDYTNPEKNTFSYQLAGFSTEWSKPETRHYTEFTNLKAGSYVFRVKGANSDGLWGEKELVLRITILPPFWQTWWFYGICGIAIVSFLSYIVYDILQKKELKRKKVYAQLAALRMQLNPHFVFNSLTSLEHFIVFNQNKLAIEYLVKFSRLMRMILENSAEEFILLRQETEFLDLYIFMESLRLKDKVSFTMVCDPSLDQDHIYIPPMMLQPIVENAIIHGISAMQVKGTINISFIAEKKGFIARVEDNGIGWEAANKNKTQFAASKKSMGLRIVKERMDMIKQMHGDYAGISITEIKEPGRTGTIIEIKIPYIHETESISKPADDQVSYR